MTSTRITPKLLVGDALTRLKELPSESIQCCVTSPPYWGLRDYQTGRWEGGDEACDHKVDSQTAAMKQKRSTLGPNRDGLNPDNSYFKGVDEVYRSVCKKCGAHRTDSQLGREPTPEAYTQAMVEVFREVRRVLRKDGTLWLNLGDSYSSAGGGGEARIRRGAIEHGRSGERPHNIIGIRPKNLIGIPWRVAFALQADGWYLRSDIIWEKRNPMPESITDRPTKSHEYVFLMAKSERYFYDAGAIREPHNQAYIQNRSADSFANSKSASMRSDRRVDFVKKYSGGVVEHPGGRNKRTVWTIATKPFTGAHFATMPTALVEPCVRAGTSEYGACATCGSPYSRVESRDDVAPELAPSELDRFGTGDHGVHRAFGGKYQAWLEAHPLMTVGWEPTCECGASEPVPCEVLDPFAGAGTTLLVANQLGRASLGIELNPEYAKIISDRLARGLDRPDIDGLESPVEEIVPSGSMEDFFGLSDSEG